MGLFFMFMFLLLWLFFIISCCFSAIIRKAKSFAAPIFAISALVKIGASQDKPHGFLYTVSPLKYPPITAVSSILDNLLMKNSSTSLARRVAAYIRVSTRHDEQSESLEAQRSHFWNVIHRNPNWELVDIYADNGRSATSIKDCLSLRRLLADAQSGKIDLILTKSISRLSRNTVDVLMITRSLRLIGVEIFFEKELISSLDSKCEMLLSILASIAQEESRNISENIKWGILRKMEKGDFTLPYGRFMGYERGTDGRPKIIPKEARIIRRIY